MQRMKTSWHTQREFPVHAQVCLGKGVARVHGGKGHRGGYKGVRSVVRNGAWVGAWWSNLAHMLDAMHEQWTNIVVYEYNNTRRILTVASCVTCGSDNHATA